VEAKDERPSGDFRITQVVGRSFEQAYLFRGPRGEWRVLPLSWSIARGEWDHTHLILDDISGVSGAVTDDFDVRGIVFNDGCGQCHATGYDVGHDEESGRYESSFLEGAVACESCHGPGSVHAEWHRRERGTDGYRPPARLVHPEEDLDARQQLDSCGRCHYLHDWRYAIDDDPRVSHYDIAVTMNYDRPGFLADGKLSGLNYHGTTQSQSPCYLEGGMGCLDCHQLHGGRKWALTWEEDDDAQCGQCHEEIAADPVPHTHHKDVRCVDCHMPRFMTGVLAFMRDHSIASPEPELTQRFGPQNVPNACGVCHVREGPAWAREWREKWWGPTPRRWVEDVSLVMDLRRRKGSPDGGGAGEVTTGRLVAAATNRESRAFFRLTAIRELTLRPSPEVRAALLRLLADPLPEVRTLACQAILGDPHPGAVPALLPLLQDEVRVIRVDAGVALALCGWRGKDPHYARAFQDARKALDRLRVSPDKLIRLALLADAQGHSDEMLRIFERLIQSASWRSVESNPALALRMAELYRRRGRIHAERGDHAQAVRDYELAGALFGDRRPLTLWADSADSLLEVGRSRTAQNNWRFVAAAAPPGSLPRLIARARLAALRGAASAEIGALARAVDGAADDPRRGEWLRRARWALERLGR
ncbi:MAG: HEAT repeat domain-containing protein, partial [Planctomycetota bacterium]